MLCFRQYRTVSLQLVKSSKYLFIQPSVVVSSSRCLERSIIHDRYYHVMSERNHPVPALECVYNNMCFLRNCHGNLISNFPSNNSKEYLRKLVIKKTKKEKLNGEENLEIPSEERDGFVTIYRFSHIHLSRALIMAKIWQTVATAFVLPIFAYSNMLGPGEWLGCLSVIGFSLGMLVTMSLLAQKISCIMYVNKETDTLKLAHLTFFGRRHNEFIDISNVQALTDTTEKLGNSYVKIRFYDDRKPFFLFLQYGEIKNKELFVYAFGDIFTDRFSKGLR